MTAKQNTHATATIIAMQLGRGMTTIAMDVRITALALVILMYNAKVSCGNAFRRPLDRRVMPVFD